MSSPVPTPAPPPLAPKTALRRRLERLELIVSLIDGRVEAIDNCLDDQREAIGDLQMFACRNER